VIDGVDELLDQRTGGRLLLVADDREVVLVVAEGPPEGGIVEVAGVAERDLQVRLAIGEQQLDQEVQFVREHLHVLHSLPSTGTRSEDDMRIECNGRAAAWCR